MVPQRRLDGPAIETYCQLDGGALPKEKSPLTDTKSVRVESQPFALMSTSTLFSG